VRGEEGERDSIACQPFVAHRSHKIPILTVHTANDLQKNSSPACVRTSFLSHWREKALVVDECHQVLRLLDHCDWNSDNWRQSDSMLYDHG